MSLRLFTSMHLIKRTTSVHSRDSLLSNNGFFLTTTIYVHSLVMGIYTCIHSGNMTLLVFTSQQERIMEHVDIGLFITRHVSHSLVVITYTSATVATTTTTRHVLGTVILVNEVNRVENEQILSLEKSLKLLLHFALCNGYYTLAT